MAFTTPNAGFTEPAINSFGWGGPTNANWSRIDAIFGGIRSISGLRVSGDVLIGGTITANVFAALDGSFFLQSNLFNQANGIPQLNGAGKIPPSLLAPLANIVVPYSATPTFNAALASGFTIALTGDVSASLFINGTSAGALACIRVKQDSSGGHAFVWPSNVRNAGTVSADANSTSTQLFMVAADGSLDAAAPMMYS